jgi:single-stranded DNA-binding protein
MSKSQGENLPLEPSTVSTKNGETKVLNLQVVDYWTPDQYSSMRIKVAVWGDRAQTFADVLQHNAALYIAGEMHFEEYEGRVPDSELTVKKFSPIFSRVFEIRPVDVTKTSTGGERSEPETSIAEKAASAARKTEEDDVPF